MVWATGYGLRATAVPRIRLPAEARGLKPEAWVHPPLTHFDKYRIDGDVKRAEKPTDVKRMTRVFRALSNPNRLQIFLNLLRQSQLDLAAGRSHTCFLSTLLENLRVGAPTVSHHVRELENADLIQTRRDGKQLLCSVNPRMVHELQALFAELAAP